MSTLQILLLGLLLQMRKMHLFRSRNFIGMGKNFERIVLEMHNFPVSDYKHRASWRGISNIIASRASLSPRNKSISCADNEGGSLESGCLFDHNLLSIVTNGEFDVHLYLLFLAELLDFSQLQLWRYFALPLSAILYSALHEQKGGK